MMTVATVVITTKITTISTREKLSRLGSKHPKLVIGLPSRDILFNVLINIFTYK